MQIDKFLFDLEMSFGEKAVSVAFIKKTGDTGVEGGAKSVASQLQTIHLGDSSPFDTLHNYVHNSFAPLVRSIVNRSQKKGTEKESKLGMLGEDNFTFFSCTLVHSLFQGMGIGAVNQKIAELELSLYNCKQDVQIQQVYLTFHPDIKAAAAKVAFFFSTYFILYPLSTSSFHFPSLFITKL
jgi:hypothetical protein